MEALFLRGLGFWAVFVQELEGLCGGVAVEGILELSDRRRDFEAEVEDLLLALKTDIFWPTNHAGEISCWLNILAYTVVAGTLLDERVLRASAYQPQGERGKNCSDVLLRPS